MPALLHAAERQLDAAAGAIAIDEDLAAADALATRVSGRRRASRPPRRGRNRSHSRARSRRPRPQRHHRQNRAEDFVAGSDCFAAPGRTEWASHRSRRPEDHWRDDPPPAPECRTARGLDKAIDASRCAALIIGRNRDSSPACRRAHWRRPRRHRRRNRRRFARPAASRRTGLAAVLGDRANDERDRLLAIGVGEDDLGRFTAKFEHAFDAARRPPSARSCRPPASR